MKLFGKINLLITALLLISVNCWAFPITDADTVVMRDNDTLGQNYSLQLVRTGDYFNAFCLENKEYFNPGYTYDVDSVVDYAVEGGIDTGGPNDDDPNWTDGDNMDYVSFESKWLYAAFFEGVFTGYTDEYVQNAIWYAEDEITNASYFTTLMGFKTDANKGIVDKWEFKVVNISRLENNQTVTKQSQLVGVAPVPEPATMVLFGLGLLGLAGISRKKS